jgi:hypothetical protein
MSNNSLQAAKLWCDIAESSPKQPLPYHLQQAMQFARENPKNMEDLSMYMTRTRDLSGPHDGEPSVIWESITKSKRRQVDVAAEVLAGRLTALVDPAVIVPYRQWFKTDGGPLWVQNQKATKSKVILLFSTFFCI